MSAAPPANFNHCVAIYQLMAGEAKDQEIEGLGTQIVWTGYTTKLFDRLNLPTPYYSTIIPKLEAMGCIEQMTRGGGGSPSKWYLFREPTIELFEESKDRPRGRPSKKDIEEQFKKDVRSMLARLSARVEALEKRAHAN